MKKFASAMMALALVFSLTLVGCQKADTKDTTDKAKEMAKEATDKAKEMAKDAADKAKEATDKAKEMAKDAADKAKEAVDKAQAPAPNEEGAAGFDEIEIGDEVTVGPLNIAGVYFQPVDMEPAGNSLSSSEADCHIEADISAAADNKLGYEEGVFVPYLTVKAYLQKEGSDKVQEIAFMPMNASDGPHYGANIKFEEGLGKYHVKFEVFAPKDYLIHVDKTTGVEGRFWTEPLVAEWDMEWAGPKW